MWGTETLVLDRYKIVDHLGGGSFGDVYKAEDTKGDDGMVALKQSNSSLISLAPEDKEYLERARHEAKLLERTRSPHVVRYIADGVYDDYFVIVMELAGDNLSKILAGASKGTAPVDEPRARSIILQCLLGLSDAYRAACVAHRDIKLANIFLSPSGLIKVGDFGISKLRDIPGLTRPGITMGTFAYMAPECFVDPKTVDYRADVYALGVCLCQLLSGSYPLDVPGELVAAMNVVTEDPPKGPNELLPGCASDEFHKLALRLLAKVPDERCTSLEALIDEFGGVGGGGLICCHCYAAAGVHDTACPTCGAPFAHAVPPGAATAAVSAGALHEAGPAPAPPPVDMSRASAALKVLRPGGDEIFLALTDGTFDVTRDVLAPGNRYVSRLHARITRDADGWRVEDLASLNGTQVNAALLTAGEHRLLKDGDAIAFADVMAHFVLSV